MSTLTVCLFGKLHVQCGEQVLADLGARKVQELFAYLLLHRKQRHSREVLASLLWGDSTTAQSRKYLRNALWRLRSVLDSGIGAGNGDVLLVEPGWVSLNPDADLWLDVATFEQVFARVQGVPGRALDTLRVQALRKALDSYRGDLLEGWFQDWCLYERERLQNMYLAILDKLMDHCEARGEYEAGLAHGARILSYDKARERTHRRLMRLYYLAGDRTAALRQYDRCVEALRRELAVRPAARTITLYEQIREERFAVTPVPATSPWCEALDHLSQLQTTLAEVQCQLQHIVRAVELAQKGQH
ncbi:MAG: BTAD domain-containing putative transcriptional regulator [Anaerolineae bacterium]